MQPHQPRQPIYVATDGLTDRDRLIMRMIAEFGGKTYIPVLTRTFWIDATNPTQAARDRVNKLKKKYKLLRHTETGLTNPQNAIAFTDFGKRWALEHTDLVAGKFFLSPVTVWHGIYEQIAYYWLLQSGRSDVSRTIVKNWSVDHRHTPDLLYFHKGKPVYVEIELNHKAQDRYVKIINDSKQDGVHAMLYVYENEKKMVQLGKKLPNSDLIYITNIDALIQSVRNTGKIGAMKQKDFMKKIGEKK